MPRDQSRSPDPSLSGKANASTVLVFPTWKGIQSRRRKGGKTETGNKLRGLALKQLCRAAHRTLEAVELTRCPQPKKSPGLTAQAQAPNRDGGVGISLVKQKNFP